MYERGCRHGLLRVAIMQYSNIMESCMDSDRMFAKDQKTEENSPAFAFAFALEQQTFVLLRSSNLSYSSFNVWFGLVCLVWFVLLWSTAAERTDDRRDEMEQEMDCGFIIFHVSCTRYMSFLLWLCPLLAICNHGNNQRNKKDAPY